MLNSEALGILSDAEIEILGRLKLGILKIQDAVDRLNKLAKDSGLPLREVPLWPCALMAGDISQLAFAHQLADQRIKDSALAVLEKNIKQQVRTFAVVAPERVAA